MTEDSNQTKRENEYTKPFIVLLICLGILAVLTFALPREREAQIQHSDTDHICECVPADKSTTPP